MEQFSVDDLNPLVKPDRLKKKPLRVNPKKRSDIALATIVLICTIATLVCIAFQLKMFLLYLDLKQQASQSRQIIAQCINQTDSAQNARGKRELGNNGFDESENDTESYEILDYRQKTMSDYELDRRDSQIDSDNPIGDMVKSRHRRSDDPRRNNNNNNRRPKNNNRGRTEETSQVAASHLEIHLRHGSTFRVAKDDIITHWRQNDNYPEQSFMEYSENSVTILKRGVYLIYAQMTFEDRYGRWSYSIMVNNQSFIKCLTTEWGIEDDPEGNPVTTYGQCHTAAVAFLRNGDTVHMKSLYRAESIHTDADLSFWGFVKLS